MHSLNVLSIYIMVWFSKGYCVYVTKRLQLFPVINDNFSGLHLLHGRTTLLAEDLLFNLFNEIHVLEFQHDMYRCVKRNINEELFCWSLTFGRCNNGFWVGLFMKLFYGSLVNNDKTFFLQDLRITSEVKL